MKLHEKIHYYRTLGKLSQEELAELAGVSRQAVSKWELGDATPEVSKLMALARAFGVTVDELLSEEPPTLGPGPGFVPGPEAEPDPEEPPKAPSGPRGEDQFDRAAGFFGRLIKRHGWLAGLYIAWSGVGFTVFGVIGLVMVNAFTREASQMMGGFGDFGGAFGGGGGYITFPDGSMASFDSSGNLVMGGPSGGGFGSFLAIIPGAFLVIGVAMIVGGLILAWYLRKKGRDS